MLTRKALLLPAVASAGLLLILAVAGWGNDDAGSLATPTSQSHVQGTTPPVSIVPTPELAEITVKTTTPPPTTTTTTTRPAPPPVQAPPPVVTTTPPPQEGLFVLEGAPCAPEGATGIDIRGEALVCEKERGRGGRLRWRKA